MHGRVIFQWRIILLLVLPMLLPGCGPTRGGEFAGGMQIKPNEGQQRLMLIELDRQAILGMAGTYKVSFDFEETLALREGYELHKPYHQEAEELVIVIEDRGDYIALQHLLVLRFDDQTEVINHWRQDWQYESGVSYRYVGNETWSPMTFEKDQLRGAWMQSVYNVADSPRYASVGRWIHRNGVSSWTGSPIDRPLPLREAHLGDQYALLSSINTHVVTAKGWIHYQNNEKVDPSNQDQPVLSLERGMNRYTRIPDVGFEKAHAYWANTSAFWKEVRAEWSEVFAKDQPIALAERWRGDTLYGHLFGLADDYWGVDDAREARPKIREIINGFIEDRQTDQP